MAGRKEGRKRLAIGERETNQGVNSLLLFGV